MKIAVVAHYDPRGRWEENFLAMLCILQSVAEQIIIVTTSPLIEPLPESLRGAVLIHRPNIGYDFYSYRAGIHAALEERNCSGLFLVNSSFFVLDERKFRDLLLSLASDSHRAGVRGVTSSRQFGWHLQSYLLYFDLRRLPPRWLRHFFEHVEPLNSKIEIVLAYEIGLGRELMRDRITSHALFQPRFRDRVISYFQYLKSRSCNGERRFWLNTFKHRTWHEINWVHFGANQLAAQFGIVKAEILRTNPHRISLDQIWRACSPNFLNSIRDSVEGTSPYYVAQKNGLTELDYSKDSMRIIDEIIDVGRHRSIGPRLAVVVHLFYIDLLDEIFSYLINIPEPFDLYVTTPFQADIPRIIDAADKLRFSLTVVLTRNKGRDVGPFLALFRTKRLDRYDAVLKLHSKKSLYSEQGREWRNQLYSPLCGTSLTALRAVSLIRSTRCGIVGQGPFFLTNPKFWGANRKRLTLILLSCGLQVSASGPKLAFFAGTMFWFSPTALRRIHTCSEEALLFEDECGAQDGTLAHAWERAFCLLAQGEGFVISTVELQGKEINLSSQESNGVPVLS